MLFSDCISDFEKIWIILFLSFFSSNYSWDSSEANWEFLQLRPFYINVCLTQNWWRSDHLGGSTITDFIYTGKMPMRPFVTIQYLNRWHELQMPGPDKTWHHQPDASFFFSFFWLSLLFCEIMRGGKALRHFSICCFGLGEMRSIKLEMEGEPGSEEMCSGGTKSCRRRRERERERERNGERQRETRAP